MSDALTPATKRPARAPRRFTAIHNLPAGRVPDVAGLLIEFFGPALVQATQSPAPATAAAPSAAVVSLLSTNPR
jgi:hypothetical protein